MVTPYLVFKRLMNLRWAETLESKHKIDFSFAKIEGALADLVR